MRRPAFRASLTFLLPALAVAAELPPVRTGLVKDFNTELQATGSEPVDFIALGGRVYFSALHPLKGKELFSTDAAGALRLVGDIAPGPDGSLPQALSIVGEQVIVSADDGSTGRQLWSLPVAGGAPVRLTSIGSFWGYPSPTAIELAALGTRSLLHIPSDSYSLWSSDGTPAGTFALPEDASFPISLATHACALDGAAVVAGSATGGYRIARTNGLPGGGLPLAVLPAAAEARASVRAGSQCYFLFGGGTGGGWRLWSSDGTPAGTRELASAASGSASTLAALGDAAYFIEVLADNTLRLQRISVAQPVPQPLISLPALFVPNLRLIASEGRLVFNGVYHNGSGYVAGLYASDGTVAGTRRVYPAGTNPWVDTYDWHLLGGNLLLDQIYGDLNIDLASGSITPFNGGGFHFGNSVVSGRRRIGSGDGPHGREVWISDGTTAGSQLLNDVWTDTGDGLNVVVRSAVAKGDQLYFTQAIERVEPFLWRRRLWRTDGSEEGTVALPRAFHEHESPYALQHYGDSLLFATRTDYAGGRVYYTDAALSGAIPIGAAWSSPLLQPLHHGAGALFSCDQPFLLALCAFDAGGARVVSSEDFLGSLPIGQAGGTAILQRGNSLEIWRSDGTAAGTFRLLAGRQILPGGPGPVQAELNGALYFISCTASYACDLTATDGTVAGTRLLHPVAPGMLRSAARAGARLVLGTEFGANSQIWSTDGTAAGTQLLFARGALSDFASIGDYVHLRASCSGCKDDYLVTDGTPGGTHTIDLPGQLRADGMLVANLADEAVVFSCSSPTRGRELCLTDATGSVVAGLPEIFPGSYDADPRVVGSTAHAVFFSADDGRHGQELWVLQRLPDRMFADGFD